MDMSESKQISRDFITEFLSLYRSLPCLWRVKSKEYTDRIKKQEAYNVLVKKFREVDKSADRDMVVKKIDSFRGSFRKELRKIRKNLKTSGPTYQPRLWYFDHLTFLIDQDDKTNDEIDEGDGEVNLREPHFLNISSSEEHLNHIPSLDTCSRSSNGESSSTMNPQPDLRYESEERKDDEDCFSYQPSYAAFRDDFSIYGENVASRLREAKQDRRAVAIAKNKIDNILFQLEMGEFAVGHKIDDIAQMAPVPASMLPQLKRIRLTAKDEM